MTITPNPVDITKGQVGTVEVSAISGTLEVTTANVGIKISSVNQTGDSATVIIQVRSAAVGSTGNVTFHDDSGDTTLVVNMLSDEWNATLTGTDVFARQQEMANLLDLLHDSIEGIQTLIAIGLGGQIASLAATLAALSAQIQTVNKNVKNIQTGTVSVIGSRCQK